MIFSSKQRGFSLVELLVVVAIIGILAAVGIFGYRLYLDNTKADVARSNAESVARWVNSTGIARQGGLALSPSQCEVGSLTIDNCLDNATASGEALGGLENPYNATEQGRAVIEDNITGECSVCSESNPGAYGRICINSAEKYNHNSSSNQLGVLYCDGDAEVPVWTSVETGIAW